MGLADLTNPTAISIYANSFEDKEKIVQFIEDYNEANPKDKIKYADMLSMMMSFANTLTDVITKVLIGFSAISLIVSSIMIAVIIYTSVLERRKEVGTLRSVGARKKDITTIFMTESGILGALGGLIGVFVGWLITIPVNFVLETLVGIPNLANVEWYYAVAMV
ncbi:MAG: FtsX-like permease family protein, partial [Clostridia bacterium]|nr:FtsX-like permease family protein [Clostridia bacterium]